MVKRRVQTKDKWKKKVWYELVAPGVFGEAVVGETPADDPKKVIGRVVRVHANQLTGKSRQSNMAVMLRASEVKGTKAKTEIYGFEMTRTYIRSIVRRRRDKVDVVQDVETKDGKQIRVKSIIITVGKCHRKQQKGLANKAGELIKAEAEGQDFGDFMNKVLNRVVQESVKENIRKIFPVSHMEIRKIELN